MKKIISLVILFFAVLSLSACGNSVYDTCLMCEKPVTHPNVTSGGFGYCDEHYEEYGRFGSGSSSSSSFTNKYGTSTTKCAKSGCSNYIASSGDTNCCTTHSNRCLKCNCYIDGDAMYCMSCLEEALGG